MTTFRGTVRDAGGGVVEIVVDRDTVEYPKVGATVAVTTTEPWEHPRLGVAALREPDGPCADPTCRWRPAGRHWHTGTDTYGEGEGWLA